MPIVLVGNKADKPKAVPKERVIEEWLDNEKAVAYLEASATRLQGVIEIF